MKITELTYTVTKSGGLRIPADIIKEMGINPGENVRVAYLSSDGDKNEFREFVTPNTESYDPLLENINWIFNGIYRVIRIT